MNKNGGDKRQHERGRGEVPERERERAGKGRGRERCRSGIDRQKGQRQKMDNFLYKWNTRKTFWDGSIKIALESK